LVSGEATACYWGQPTPMKVRQSYINSMFITIFYVTDPIAKS